MIMELSMRTNRIMRQAALAVALVGFAPAAFAYLDPSTGSMIVSAIIGIFATLSLAIKTYWYRLKGLFRGKSNAPGGSSDDAAPQRNGETPDA
jgi:O-antigen/teichoic acid export membrane protein